MTVSVNLDGAGRAVAINPAEIGIFEDCLGRAFAMLRRFTSGVWTALDVANVITFAAYGATPAQRHAWKAKAEPFGVGIMPPIAVHPAVKAAIEREGAGNLADKAAAVLTELLFREG